MTEIVAQPLTAEVFAPYGDVLEIAGAPDKIINQGLCGRYHDRAALDFGPGGRAGIRPPSIQVTFTGGRLPRAGNW